MSSEKLKPPEGFQTFDGNDGTDDEQPDEIDLEPGDQLCGVVLDLHSGEGEYGPWHRLRIADDERGVVDYFAEGDAKRACTQETVMQGDRVWIGKEEVEDTWTNDDGEEHTFYPVRFAHAENGGDS